MNGRRILFAVLLCAACDGAHEPSADELTIVVQGDRRELEQQEKALRQREEALGAEKRALDARIEELSKGLKAAADGQQRRRLEDELRKHKELQTEVSAQESALVAQKSQVEAQRYDTDAQRLVASREARIAQREAELAGREKVLAEREKGLQAMTAQVTQLQQQLAAQLKAAPQATPQLAARDVPRAAALDTKHKKLLAELNDRGLLVTDFPAEEQPLNAEIWAARRQGDLSRAWDLVADLQKAMAKLKVDQKFVEQKMLRLQGARSSAKISAAQRTDIEKLLREVTSAYSDGKYEQANKGLNRIASILDAGASPG